METSRAERTPPIVDLHNALVTADADLRLATLARWCRLRGIHFPLARPLPGVTLGEACARFPAFADACVASVEGEVSGGKPVDTPRAPRAALGPDFCGALMLRAPLFVPRRMRLRVCDAARSRVSRETYTDVRDALASLQRTMDEGRTFFLEAVRVSARFHVLRIDSSTLPPCGEEIPAFAHAAGLRAHAGTSLWPGDVASWEAALLRTDRLWAAPYLGRIGCLSALHAPPSGVRPVAPDLEGACLALAQHLVRRESARVP